MQTFVRPSFRICTSEICTRNIIFHVIDMKFCRLCDLRFLVGLFSVAVVIPVTTLIGLTSNYSDNYFDMTGSCACDFEF